LGSEHFASKLLWNNSGQRGVEKKHVIDVSFHFAYSTWKGRCTHTEATFYTNRQNWHHIAQRKGSAY